MPPRTKRQRILLGLATLWPLFYMVSFFVLTFGFLLYSFHGQFPPVAGSSPPLHPPRPPGPPNPAAFLMLFPMIGLFMVHCLTMLWMIGMMVFYIREVFRNPLLGETQRLVWTTLFVLMGMLSAPIYWFIYIWRQPTSDPLMGGA